MLLHLLASMSEGLGEKLIQDVVQVATFLRVRSSLDLSFLLIS